MEPRMDRYMRDRRSNMGGRDGRNPYGSRGGYVTSRRPRGRDRMYYDDRTMGGDGGYYEGTFRGQTDRNMYDRYDRMHDNFDDRNMDMDMDYAQRVLNDTELNEGVASFLHEIWSLGHKMLFPVQLFQTFFGDVAVIRFGCRQQQGEILFSLFHFFHQPQQCFIGFHIKETTGFRCQGGKFRKVEDIRDDWRARGNMAFQKVGRILHLVGLQVQCVQA